MQWIWPPGDPKFTSYEHFKQLTLARNILQKGVKTGIEECASQALVMLEKGYTIISVSNFRWRSAFKQHYGEKLHTVNLEKRA